MTASREQQYFDLLVEAAEATGNAFTTNERGKIMAGLKIIIPIWDKFMPLLVGDITRTVIRTIKEEEHAQSTLT